MSWVKVEHAVMSSMKKKVFALAKKFSPD